MTKKFFEFFDKLEEDGFLDREYTIEEAIEFIEDLYYGNFIKGKNEITY